MMVGVDRDLFSHSASMNELIKAPSMDGGICAVIGD